MKKINTNGNISETTYRQMDPDFGRAYITGLGFGEIDKNDYAKFCELVSK